MKLTCKQSPLERFHLSYKVSKKTGCWVWFRSKWRSNTRPVLKINGVRVLAHVFIHRTVIGPTKGLYVCHTCDNTLCVNPDHLFLGTAQDNMDDKVSKGRGRNLFGSGHQNAKLDEEKVRFIRTRYIPRHPVYGKGPLAKRFKVAYGTLSNILQGKQWKHV